MLIDFRAHLAFFSSVFEVFLKERERGGGGREMERGGERERDTDR